MCVTHYDTFRLRLQRCRGQGCSPLTSFDTSITKQTIHRQTFCFILSVYRPSAKTNTRETFLLGDNSCVFLCLFDGRFLEPCGFKFFFTIRGKHLSVCNISMRNDFAFISFHSVCPFVEQRDKNASSAVISISEMKSTPFSATSKELPNLSGQDLISLYKYLSAGASLFGVRVIARMLLTAPAMSIEPLVR